MRIRSNWLACLLLAGSVALCAGVAAADQHEEPEEEEFEIEEYKGGTVDPSRQDRADAEAADAKERMGALSDLRFGPDTHILSRVPFGLNRMADLAIFRTLNVALGLMSAFTYGVAVGPTLAFDREQHHELVTGLLVEPWRLLWKRPLGSPLDYRARDAVDDAGEVELPAQ